MFTEQKIAAVPRGFRSSFRDWAAEKTNHPREVVEAALAHVVRDKVEAAYARSDLFERRRHLMNDCEEYLNGQHAACDAFDSAVQCRRLRTPSFIGHTDDPNRPNGSENGWQGGAPD